MKILWIPNNPGGGGAVPSSQHLIRHLKDHHEILRITWPTRDDFKTPSGLLNALRFRRWDEEGVRTFNIRRTPDVTRSLRNNRLRASRLNEHLFQQDVRRIIRAEDVDVIVTAYTEYVTGQPPFEVNVPIIFHYLDCDDWEKHPERPTEDYMVKSDGVVGVSQLAVERAKQYNDSVAYITNGVDVERFRTGEGNRVRTEYGLANATVVSLIGLSVRAYYFIDAVVKAHESMPELRCLLVGQSETIRRRVESIPEEDNPFIYVGPVPHEQIPDILDATDVGLYPVIHDDYNDGRSPIKVFEYTAAKVPVVMPPVKETRYMDFGNFVFVEPTSDGMAAGIQQAARLGPVSEPSIEKYDLERLAEKWEIFLRETAGT